MKPEIMILNAVLSPGKETDVHFMKCKNLCKNENSFQIDPSVCVENGLNLHSSGAVIWL